MAQRGLKSRLKTRSARPCELCRRRVPTLPVSAQKLRIRSKPATCRDSDFADEGALQAGGLSLAPGRVRLGACDSRRHLPPHRQKNVLVKRRVMVRASRLCPSIATLHPFVCLIGSSPGTVKRPRRSISQIRGREPTSGGTKLSRPGVETAMVRIEGGGTEGIVVAELHRFARSLVGASETINVSTSRRFGRRSHRVFGAAPPCSMRNAWAAAWIEKLSHLRSASRAVAVPPSSKRIR
jgi:hypothetical protein